MKNLEEKCKDTTQHIANKLTKEAFAERVNLDLSTIARAERGKHRPSAQTMELIALTFQIPISYFFDESKYKTDIWKTALIYEINTKLNVLSKTNIQKVKEFIDII